MTVDSLKMMTVDPHSDDVQQLVGLGLDYDQAERALKVNVLQLSKLRACVCFKPKLTLVTAIQRWGDVPTAAANFFEGNLNMPDSTTDDEPPPLVAVDDPPVYDAFGPYNYVEPRINTTPTPSASKEVALWGELPLLLLLSYSLSLTSSHPPAPPDGPPPSAGGVIDLTRDADKGSNSDELARALKLSTETEADDFDKALAMSMSDLRGNDAIGGGAAESIPAEQRIRTENE